MAVVQQHNKLDHDCKALRYATDSAMLPALGMNLLPGWLHRLFFKLISFCNTFYVSVVSHRTVADSAKPTMPTKPLQPIVARSGRPSQGEGSSTTLSWGWAGIHVSRSLAFEKCAGMWCVTCQSSFSDRRTPANNSCWLVRYLVTVWGSTYATV